MISAERVTGILSVAAERSNEKVPSPFWDLIFDRSTDYLG